MRANHRLVTSAFLLLHVVLCLPTSADDAQSSSQTLVTISPQQTDEILANPDMGWETFHRSNDSITLPADIPAGVFDLSLAVVDQASSNPVVRLGIKGRKSDGWYPLSKIKVNSERPKMSYSTRFQLDEDPVSEGGKWINGGKDGLDWYDVITKNGVAYGAVSKGDYTDPTALLVGTWGRNQTVKAKVFSRNQTEKYYQEVEIRLRSTLSPHRCTGYEVFWRCLKTQNAYAEIVRWNGKVRDWTSLKKHTGAQYGVKEGDLVEATIAGNVIKGYVNGVEVVSATDNTYKDGNPGMGFNYGVGASNGDFGFSSYEVDSYDE